MIEVEEFRCFIGWEVSLIFYGRDVFGLVGVFIDKGVLLEEFVVEVLLEDLVKFDVKLKNVGNEWLFKVIYVDDFGNVILNFEDYRRLREVEFFDFGLRILYFDIYG